MRFVKKHRKVAVLAAIGIVIASAIVLSRALRSRSADADEPELTAPAALPADKSDND